MKTSFLNWKLSISLTLFTALGFSCSLLPDEHWQSNHHPGNENTLTKLSAIHARFAITEKNKDAEGQRQLFASDSSGLNFVLKNYGNPVLASLTRDQWIGFFTNWDYDFFSIYTDSKFYIRNGVAIDRHHFQGFKNGVPDISGTDLFMYIETHKGWKLLNISSTILNPDDSTDYNSLHPISTSPQETFTSFLKGVNSHDQTAFENSFLSSASACFRFKNKISEFDDYRNSAKAFFSAISQSNAFKVTLTNLDIRVSEQLVALASSGYTIKKNNIIVEKGEMLATLVATPGIQWKISTIAFSAGNR